MHSPLSFCLLATLLPQAFRLFDTDKVGSIDYHELKVAMRALGCDVRKAEVKALVAEHSKDGSERVDFEAFLAISACTARATSSARLAHRDLCPSLTHTHTLTLLLTPSPPSPQ